MTTQQTCNWNTPGNDPFRGSLLLAIMSYKHIDGRFWLWRRIKFGDPPDDTPAVTKTGIASTRFTYLDGPNDMFFGRDRSCADVVRDGWADDHIEPSRVWFNGEWGVGISDVCGNPWWCRRVLPKTDGRHTVSEPALLVPTALLALVIARRMKLQREGGR